MDVNCSDQNGKPPINTSAEDHRDAKEKNELPPILRPKFSKYRHRRRRNKNKSTSKETSKETSREQSKDDDTTATVELKHDGLDKNSEDKDDEKPSVEKPDKRSKEKLEPEDGGHRDLRNDREREPRERETEEPECRESEIRIITVEPVGSDTDVRKPTTPIVVNQDDKSDEKKKKKADKADSLDEGEKKRSKESKNPSRRKRSGDQKVKRNSGRNQPSEERKRRKRAPNLSKESVNQSPRASLAIPVKQNSKENVVQKKSKVPANKISDSASKVQPIVKYQQAPPKKKSFFKSIFDKTKFWMRKSDDVAQPTKEMLFKSYVNPEYDMNNPADFLPDPRHLFSKIDWELRLRNSRCEPDLVFINNRPFWIHRTNEDVIPKVKLLGFNGLVAQHEQTNGTCYLKELPKRTFYDPKKAPIEKLIAMDKMIGVDPTDPNKEKELQRVTSNTFFGTCHMQAYRISVEGKKKLEEFEAKYAKEAQQINDAPKVTFQLSITPPPSVIHQPKDPSVVEKSQRGSHPQMATYNRKERPTPGSSRAFVARDMVLEIAKKQSKMQISASPSPDSPNPPIAKKVN
ncbi:hypothetical protein B9Z55_011865 [Caenorhabditis nigoni]|uniref:Uncharacterized protein n=1 Tax=Caenorhabditis nigoni TaxID=1611254 RepID=A0A2G5ULX4_9PELO|nr:hypothetical protein B9Z55_011865 [Caenorhabditis nigoni]